LLKNPREEQHQTAQYAACCLLLLSLLDRYWRSCCQRCQCLLRLLLLPPLLLLLHKHPRLLSSLALAMPRLHHNQCQGCTLWFPFPFPSHLQVTREHQPRDLPDLAHSAVLQFARTNAHQTQQSVDKDAAVG
jgi:hypothetical protein